MRAEYIKFVLFSTITLFISCTNSDKSVDQSTIDFGNLKSMKRTELVDISRYLKLESSDESLFGTISQMEIYNDRIYILDRDRTNSLYVFSLNGKFIKKLESKGSGPGEFISPHSFWIDRDGSVLILDRMQNRLLKYKLESLEFVCEILMPSPSPLSFAKMPGEDKYVYYYPLRKDNSFGDRLLIVADDKGEVCKRLYDALPANKILHGNSSNIYLFNEHLRFYPNFSNKVYEVNDDSLSCCYKFFWENSEMPDDKLFAEYGSSGDVMKEILTGEQDWIRLLYVYETEQEIVVKYYIKKDFYVSVCNKQTGKRVNVKVDEIVNDSKLSDYFPLPIGVCDNEIVGYINPYEIDKEMAKDKELLKLLENVQDESNPILVFYNFR